MSDSLNQEASETAGNACSVVKAEQLRGAQPRQNCGWTRGRIVWDLRAALGRG